MPSLPIHAGHSPEREAKLTELLRSCGLEAWREAAARRWERPEHGDYPRWRGIVRALPRQQALHIELNSDQPEIGAAEELDATRRERLNSGLRALSPWRKGPFSMFGISIDAEWRSFMKWNRLLPHLSDLRGRRVLDVGSSNGYYLLRMAGLGARLALGVEPNWLANWQFSALTRFLPPEFPAGMIPGRLEDSPEGKFDSVFSMGVLHHRRDPDEHIRRLRQHLRPGGELLLETLIREDVPPSGESLIDGRYARMRNVRALWNPERVLRSLNEAGFRSPRQVNRAITTPDEQRATNWMRFHSLREALDPSDQTRTVEGHPAPVRAIFVATAASR